MDDVEELPTWAAKTHVPGTNIPVEEVQPQLPEPRKRRPLRVVLIALLGLLALAGMAALGYFAANLATDDGTGAASDESATDGAADTDADEDAGATSSDGSAADDSAGGSTATDAASDGDAAAGESGERSTDTATAAAASEGDDGAATDEDGAAAVDRGEPVDNSDGSIRYAVLQGGQLFLRGRVHSAEYGQRIEEVALGVMGPGNVINEYEVDPTTPDTIGGPVYVEDVVLFDFNSVEIAPPFLPILDLGTALMVQNPSVEITVVSRTDSVGSEAVNMEVSEQRAQAVLNYWIRQGVDPSRVTLDPKGEAEAAGDGESEEAALDRRVEFVINNLFG